MQSNSGCQSREGHQHEVPRHAQDLGLLPESGQDEFQAIIRHTSAQPGPCCGIYLDVG